MSRVLPYVPASRPKIAIVGEAAGMQEIQQGKPFVGASGQELTKMLRDAGINRHECYITNVFWTRPPGNKVEGYCGKKAEMGKYYPYPPLRSGKYLRPLHLEDVEQVESDYINSLSERFDSPISVCPKGVDCIHDVLERLYLELRIVKPNIVIALGNTACWALLGRTGITTLRGCIAESTLVPGLKVLPTFHPAAILRQWTNRVITLADLVKAKRESEFPEIRVPAREIKINPTVYDVERFFMEALRVTSLLAFDIETAGGTISCIGFAPSKSCALVIPFMDPSKLGYHYWSREDEIEVWKWVRIALKSNVPKVAQNGLYDLQYLWRAGIPVNGLTHDTMILHHALQPEMPKSLAFLGSVYTDSPSWKHLRPKKLTAGKGDD